MNTAQVEQVIAQSRLLARRDSPCIDWNIEVRRQQLLDMYFEFQDGMRQFNDLMPIVCLLQEKIDINHLALKWEQEYGIED